MGKPRALIYISDPARQHAETRYCLTHLEHNDYDLVGVIIDHDGTRLRDAYAALGNDVADVIIVAGRHLNERSTPRLEQAGERPNRNTIAADRRPRRL